LKSLGGYLEAGTSFLERVIGGFSELVSDFKEASSFLHQKAAKY
jgi:hypothetical protein